MTSEGSKRRDFLSLVFITKSISKRLLIKITCNGVKTANGVTFDLFVFSFELYF